MSSSEFPNTKDGLLISQLKRGDERAFKKLYDKYSSGIYGFSLSMVKSTDFAEEVVQDVFFKVWNIKEDLDINQNFKSLIFTIAKNLSLNILKKAAHDLSFRNQLLQIKEVSSTSTKDHLLNKEYEIVKKNAINSLSESRRTIFLMSREQGMSYEEIAVELGISINTVKTQMKKSLKILREYLSEHGDIEFLALLTINITFFKF